MTDASVVMVKPTAPAGPATEWRLDVGDRATIVLLCVIFLIVVSAFFWFIQALLGFPADRISSLIKDRQFDYFAYALEYRERRLTLALILRTFISCLGFIVGLVLSVIGGIFILRRALIDFSASGGTESNGADLGTRADGKDPDVKAAATALAKLFQGLSLRVATNSPGIIFLLGGVVVIYVTQLLSIQVGAPEIFPSVSVTACDRLAQANGTCYLGTSSPGPGDIQVIQAFCAGNPNTPGCTELGPLLNRAGITSQEGSSK